MNDYHKLSDEEFAAACNAYRAMMRANEGKSHKEQLEAINRFRCGNYKKNAVAKEKPNGAHPTTKHSSSN